MFRWQSIALSCIILVGCASNGNMDPTAVKAETQGKSIAVASLVGTQLHLKSVGTTIFNIEEGVVDVTSWTLDEVVLNSATSSLLQTGRFGAVSSLRGVSRNRDEVPKMPEGANVAYLLLFENVRGEDPMFLTREYFEGIGVAQNSFLGVAGATNAYVWIKASLFDIAAGKLVSIAGEVQHWPINARLKPAENSKMTWNKYPETVISEGDLSELQRPVVERLKIAVDALIEKVGLR